MRVAADAAAPCGGTGPQRSMTVVQISPLMIRAEAECVRMGRCDPDDMVARVGGGVVPMAGVPTGRELEASSAVASSPPPMTPA